MRSIPEKETLTVEFKSDRKCLKDSALVDEVTGMTNTEGGDLYLGVEDNGSVTGVHVNHRNTVGVAAMIGNRTVPSVPVRVEMIQEEGTDVLKINIPVSHTIISTSDGKILRRRLKVDGSPEIIPMRPYEINTRLSDLGSLDFSATVLPEATQEDLDPLERERLRQLIQNHHGEQALLELDDEELDSALGIQKNGHPTLAGIILIGRKESIQKFVPTVESSFQVLQGGKVLVNDDFHLPLLATFDLFYQRFISNNPETEMERHLQRIPIPEFSRTAFREALVNAFAHRDYSQLGRVRVAIEDEGLTISNPGGFIENISYQNLLSAEPQSRNPLLADALKRIGLAERTGRGIDRIFEGSIQYGRPLPDYSESTSTSVKLFIPRHKPDQGFINMLLNYQEEKGRPLSIYSQLILFSLLEQHRLNLAELTSIANVSERRIRTLTEQLVEDGMIEATGTGSSRSFILSPRVYSAKDNLFGYLRQHATGKLKEKDLVLQLAQEVADGISRKDVSQLLKISDQKAYRILKELTENKQLEIHGKGSATRYCPVSSDS